jgi:hypothetical protein
MPTSLRPLCATWRYTFSALNSNKIYANPYINPEVYTFGCAANHFNNPIRSSRYIEDRPGINGKGPINAHINDESAVAKSTKVFLSSPVTGRREHDERVVPHIEHYANSKDFVSRW